MHTERRTNKRGDRTEEGSSFYEGPAGFFCALHITFFVVSFSNNGRDTKWWVGYFPQGGGGLSAAFDTHASFLSTAQRMII